MKKLVVTLCSLALTFAGTFGANQLSLKNNDDVNTSLDKKAVVQYAEDTATQVVSNANTDSAVKGAYTAIPSSSSKNGQVIMYKNVNLSNCKNTKDVVKKLRKSGLKNINMKNVKKIAGLKDILALINGKSGSNTGTTTPAPTKAPTATPTKTPAPTATPTKAPAPTAAPTKAPAPTTAPSNNTGISNYASQVLQLINQERAKAGLSALTTNSTLKAAADKRAQEIVQSFSHTRPNGSSFSSVLKDYGISYRAAGENIAYGQKTPQEVVTAWMNSPGHRANIMNANFGKVGIGVYQKNGVVYWSQEFTN